MLARRGGLAIGLAVLVALSVGPAPAGATTTTVGCSGLQAALTGANPGDTIILDGLCTDSFSLEFDSPITLEGEPGTTSGFDGDDTAQSGPLLWSNNGGDLVGSSTNSTWTLEDLTFENAVVPTATTDNAALELTLSGTSSLVLNDDTFKDNSGGGFLLSPVYVDSYGAGSGTAGSPCTDTNTLTIENSSFTNNASAMDAETTAWGGGGLSLLLNCAADPTTITHNQFTGNTVTADSSVGLGAGLFIAGDGYLPIPVTQTDNTFSGNQVTASGSAFPYGGGGEWTQDINLTSTGDSFTSNTLPGSDGTSDFDGGSSVPNWSWGAGLSILNTADCDQTNATASKLSDDVVAGNTIADTGSDVGSDAQGAAIYLGCNPSSGSNNLTLESTTVTDNSVTGANTGAVAGVYGDTDDNLTLGNSILYGDSGGAESGGFTATGSSLTATYSDFCNGTAPDAGAGNICANPALGGGTNVAETASSPTIDAGSTALVPSGLTTDFFGNPRELTDCSTHAESVDIGAAEYALSCPAPVVATAVAPILGGVLQTHSKWTEGKAKAKLSSDRSAIKPKLAVGDTFEFTLNEQAAVTLTFTKRSAGREVKGDCVAQTKKNRKGHRACTLTAPAGAPQTFSGRAGENNVKFEGMLQSGAKLKDGSYSVSIGATSSGQTATPGTLKFTIVKK
jgi:hypothetical protein